MILKYFFVAAVCLAGWAQAADAPAVDPALRDLQRHQQQREQQRHELQLRMLQQQREAQQPRPARTLEADQSRRQQQLHYRQEIAPPSGQPSDDAGTRRGTAQIDDARAAQAREQQLQRFESELDRQKPR